MKKVSMQVKSLNFNMKIRKNNKKIKVRFSNNNIKFLRTMTEPERLKQL